jgi:hypothetical protein
VAWLRRVDQGYAWALPLTALALAFKLAPTSTAAAVAVALLAGVWLLGAALAHFTRQSPARHLWLAGLLLLLALALYLRDMHLPWPLLGMLIACALYAAAPRLGLQAAHQDWLALAVLVLAVAHVAENAFGSSQTHMGWAYAEKFALAGALLGTAWLGRQRGNGFTEVMAWAGGLWGTLALVNLLIDLNLDHWPSILFVAALAASVALFALRWAPHPAAPAALAIVLTVMGPGAASATALPWTALASLGLLVALGLLVQTALRPPPAAAGEDNRATVAGTVLLLLPLALWPWLRVTGQQMDWLGLSFSLSALMLGVLISTVFAQRKLPPDSRWHQDLAPVVFYVVAAVLAARLIGHIERDPWALVFEILALAYLALRTHWVHQDEHGVDRSLRQRYLLIGVLLIALFLQAQALRLWGPEGAVLTMKDLRHMAAPVLLSLLWAALGAVLAIGGHRLKERMVWATGAGLLVLAAGKIVLLDSGSLGSLPNILAVIAAGGLFLAVSWWAPFPPARPAPKPTRAPRKPAPAAPRAPSDAPASRPSEAARVPEAARATPDVAPAATATANPPPRAQPAPMAAARPQAVAASEWQDTQPSAYRPSRHDSEFGTASPRPRRAARSTAQAEPPGSLLWVWIIVGGMLLLMWVGYQNFQKTQLRRIQEQEFRMHQGIGFPRPQGPPTRPPQPASPPPTQPVARVEPTVSAAPKPADALQSFQLPSPPPQTCAFDGVPMPGNLLVYAAGGYSGRKLGFQIDQSGHEATQFDIAVNSPSRPVALMLGAYEPTVWNIGWSAGTQIVAVIVSGYHRQAVAGLPGSVPVLNSSSDNRGGCVYFHVDRQRNPALNPLAQRLFGKPVDMVFPGDNSGSLVIGEPITSQTRLQTSGAVTPGSFRNTSAPLAGQAGLDEAVRKGLIRRATEADINAWTAAVAAKSDNPPVAGQFKGPPARSSLLTIRPSYVVIKNFSYPSGLHGAHAVSFFIPRGVPIPTGEAGHSNVYDFNSLQCRVGPLLCPDS